ncbi:MAG TPA: hypothetical protein DCL21_00400 [Alphaproteobacteria bacterium]|nr:hypothetical protein [Alphaproteobacteria bacterium]
MQRRQFFTSLKSKTRKIASYSCYELNLTNCVANVFIRNPKSTIVLIDSNIAKFKSSLNINFCYFDLSNDELRELIKKIRSVFPKNEIAILSKYFIDAKVDKYILVNLDKNIGELNKPTLFAYDYSYLETAEKNYQQQETFNKDIFISQLFDEGALSEVFFERLAAF